LVTIELYCQGGVHTWGKQHSPHYFTLKWHFREEKKKLQDDGVGATKFWVGEKKVGRKSQKGRPDLPDFHLIG